MSESLFPPPSPPSPRTVNWHAQSVVDRVRSLQESGQLTGVLDERGRFVYLSPDEISSVASFIRPVATPLPSPSPVPMAPAQCTSATSPTWMASPA